MTFITKELQEQVAQLAPEEVYDCAKRAIDFSDFNLEWAGLDSVKVLSLIEEKHSELGFTFTFDGPEFIANFEQLIAGAVEAKQELIEGVGSLSSGVARELALRAVGVKSFHIDGCLPDCVDRSHFAVFDDRLYFDSFKPGKPLADEFTAKVSDKIDLVPEFVKPTTPGVIPIGVE